MEKGNKVILRKTHANDDNCTSFEDLLKDVKLGLEGENYLPEATLQELKA